MGSEMCVADVRTTIVISPRERFSVALDALHAVIEHTEKPYRLVYVDFGAPARVSAEIARLCAENGFTRIAPAGLLAPNEARNLGARAAATPYVAFLDNDVLVAPGWLPAMERCAEETGADIVVPLTCQKLPAHEEVHQAGGDFTTDLKAFLAKPSAGLMIEREHRLQGQKVAELKLAREDTQCCEFHCALVNRDTLEALGWLDEELLATREHIDFSISVLKRGGRIVFEPTSIVTYVFPNRASPLTREDWRFFVLRWSPIWQKRSLKRFARKWAFEGEPYARRSKGFAWRHNMAIARPLARSLWAVRRMPQLERPVAGVITAALGLWSKALAATHARQRMTKASSMGGMVASPAE